MYLIFAFIFAFQLFACNYSLIQHSTNFSSESFQALHNHLSSLPLLKRQTSPSQIYNVSILVSIDGTPKHKEFDETLKLGKVFDTINLKMRQAGFNEPIIQFFVENVVFDSSDRLPKDVSIYDPFLAWGKEFRKQYSPRYKLGVQFVRRKKYGVVGIAWLGTLCSSSASAIISGYDPESNDQIYITTFIHEVLHIFGVSHSENWESWKNSKLKKQGLTPNYTCGGKDLMAGTENGSHKVTKCTNEQLNLELGRFVQKENCLKSSPFDPNAVSVSNLALGISNNQGSESNNSNGGGNTSVSPGKNSVTRPASIPNQTSGVSTTVSPPPKVSTTGIIITVPSSPTVISKPPVSNINVGHEVVTEVYPDVISNPRIRVYNNKLINVVGS
ncbi:hypothetical protein HMI56_006485 [Coelomomyces lativittatus]|nr:hypothetical protein HMI56_006485 [Coelomomyces lativittatus]